MTHASGMLRCHTLSGPGEACRDLREGLRSSTRQFASGSIPPDYVLIHVQNAHRHTLFLNGHINHAYQASSKVFCHTSSGQLLLFFSPGFFPSLWNLVAYFCQGREWNK